eukprot:6173519-Pleurochrysis_carterae.AAC.4
MRRLAEQPPSVAYTFMEHYKISSGAEVGNPCRRRHESGTGRFSREHGDARNNQMSHIAIAYTMVCRICTGSERKVP